MKLTKAQREKILEWIGEGLNSSEINKRASRCKPSFSVSRQQVDHYRKTRDVNIEEIKQAGELTALTSGLSLKENRVALLHELAEKMRLDLLEGGRLWLPQVKGIGGMENYERVEYEEFNSAEVAQLRGVLDDIAGEVGGRARKMEHSGPDGGPIPLKDGKDEAERYDRSISALADAIREGISGSGTASDGNVDTTKQAPVAGAPVEGG